jgi:hypothetical protein
MTFWCGSVDLPDANKKLIFLKSLSAYYFLKVHLHHFSKIKSQKEVTKQWKSRVFFLFLHDDRRIQIRIMDPGGPKTCGSRFGSGTLAFSF